MIIPFSFLTSATPRLHDASGSGARLAGFWEWNLVLCPKGHVCCPLLLAVRYTAEHLQELADTSMEFVPGHLLGLGS